MAECLSGGFIQKLDAIDEEIFRKLLPVIGLLRPGFSSDLLLGVLQQSDELVYVIRVDIDYGWLLARTGILAE